MSQHTLQNRFFRTALRVRLSVAMVLLIAVSLPFVYYSMTDAAQLQLRRLQLSDSTAAATGVSYNFGFSSNTSGPIGSATFQVCSNYLYEPTDVCIHPPGFDASGATLSAQVGVTDFAMHPSSTANTLVIARPAAANVSAQPLGYVFAGITNPASIGSYYVRIATYASLDGTGPETDSGIVVFAMNQGIGITTEVPPYLLFCTGVTIDGFNCGTANGSFLNFGELSSGATRSATSQLLASTNAPYGYSVTLAGTTMTAGNNTIPAMDGEASVVGSSQFGINSRFNTQPNVGTEPIGPGLTTPSTGYNTPDRFKFKSGDIIASSDNTDDYRKLTVSYIVNTDRSQPPGRYVATISYICLANF